MNIHHNSGQETGQRIHDLWSAALGTRARHKCWTATSSTPSGSSSLGLPSTASMNWIWTWNANLWSRHDLFDFLGEIKKNLITELKTSPHHTSLHCRSHVIQNPFHFMRLPPIQTLSSLDAQFHGLTRTYSISNQFCFAFFLWPKNAKKGKHVLRIEVQVNIHIYITL